MKNKEKQTKKEPKDSRQVENLSEAELDKVAAGTTNYNSSKSNVPVAALDKATPKLISNC
jgi:hypothetical protein